MAKPEPPYSSVVFTFSTSKTVVPGYAVHEIGIADIALAEREIARATKEHADFILRTMITASYGQWGLSFGEYMRRVKLIQSFLPDADPYKIHGIIADAANAMPASWDAVADMMREAVTRQPHKTQENYERMAHELNRPYPAAATIRAAVAGYQHPRVFHAAYENDPRFRTVLQGDGIVTRHEHGPARRVAVGTAFRRDTAG